MEQWIADNPKAALAVLAFLGAGLLSAWGLVLKSIFGRIEKVEKRMGKFEETIEQMERLHGGEWKDLMERVMAAERLGPAIARLEQTTTEMSESMRETMSQQTTATLRVVDILARLETDNSRAKDDILALRKKSHEHGNLLSECAGKIQLMEMRAR